MSKYIIELKDDIQVVQKVGVTENGNAFVMNFYKDQLEELKLNSDYINKHYGDLQDEAYQRGLEDAWEAARKVGHCKLWDDYTKDTGKPSVCAVAVLDHYTASEAIEKLKSYEEKQKAEDEIKVGDEVISLRKNGEVIEDISPWIVTYETKYAYQGFDACGMFHNNPKESVRKTGRHFDISSILKEMQS